jgi:hypothetical protein
VLNMTLDFEFKLSICSIMVFIQIKSLLKLESMPLLYTQFVGVPLLEARNLTKDVLLYLNTLKMLDA